VGRYELFTGDHVAKKGDRVMYFYRLNGKQILDLRGDLVLTHNDDLVKARVKSAAPRGVRNPKYILIADLTFLGKIKAVFYAARFIWGASEALDADEGGL
jgi:hypothetical protein